LLPLHVLQLIKPGFLHIGSVFIDVGSELLHSFRGDQSLHQVCRAGKSPVLVRLQILQGLASKHEVEGEHSKVMAAFRDHVIGDRLSIDSWDVVRVHEADYTACVDVEFGENYVVDQLLAHLIEL